SVATGLKIGFCLLDSIRWNANASSNAKYDCGNQGIQKGWGDVYDSTLDGQWIDITGVPDGNYTLEMEVNPQHRLPESNYDNNIGALTVVASNDDIASTIRQSRVSFTPLAGATYYIAVDGKDGVTGNIVLTLNQNPANDNFANCEFIGGATGSVTGSNVGAT